MKPKIIDISIPIKEDMPIWPNTSGIHLKQIASLEKGDSYNETQINTSLHTGTHIDSPLHFISNGSCLDKIPLEKLIGRALVVYLPEVKAISASDLEKLNLNKETTRLLFKTANSDLWQKKQKQFQKDFVGLTPDGASWLVDHGIKLLGIDYLSVAQFDKTVEVHRILLKKSIILLEGLNLSGVKPGVYQLICLPLKLINTEAAPVRAILLPLPKK